MFFTINDNFNKLIKDVLPEANDIKQISTGWTNFVYKVSTNNAEYIFRFPRNQFFADKLKKEIDFNHFIQGKLPIATPLLIKNSDNNRIFSMHKMVEGNSLTEVSAQLTESQIESLMDEVANYIKELQKLSSNFVDKNLSGFLKELADVNRYDTYDFTILQPLKKLEEKEQVLVHGDLNPGNLILKDGKLVAIIDFAFVSYSNGLVDFSRLVGRLPQRYNNAIENSYKKYFGKNIIKESITSLTDIWKYVEQNYVSYIKREHSDIVLPY